MINPQLTELEKHDLTRLAVFLNASDTKAQAQAIDEAIQVNFLLADAAVYALQHGQDRYFVAERLHNFGSVIVEPLQALLKESTNTEAKILASLVLLRLGSKVGISILLEAVLTEPVDRYASLVVDRLAANSISEASTAIIARLRQFILREADLGKSFESNADKDFVVSSLHAMQTLNSPLPQDLLTYLTALGIPVEINSLLSSERAAESIAKTLFQDGQHKPSEKRSKE